MALVVDVETTGLPVLCGFQGYRDYKNLEAYERSRVIQLGCVLLDGDGVCIQEREWLIRPEGFVIPNAHIHGITTDRALREGCLFKDMMMEFSRMLDEADVLVMHNSMFDRHVLAADMERQGFGDAAARLFVKTSYCTMEGGKTITRIPLRRSSCSKYKYPKLSELYTHFFGAMYTNPHQALSDARACAQCYVALRYPQCFLGR